MARDRSRSLTLESGSWGPIYVVRAKSTRAGRQEPPTVAANQSVPYESCAPGGGKPAVKVVSRLRRACFGAAALLVVTAAAAPVIAKAAPNDPDADRPIVWSGTASASAIHVNADRSQGILPLKDVFFASFPEAESDWDNGTNNARASLLFPGPAGVVAVGTICEQVLPLMFGPGAIPIPASPTFDAVCRPAPTFPLTTQADNAKADARTDGSTVIGSGFPLTLVTSSAIAHADRDSVYSDTVVGAFNVVGTSAVPPASMAFRRQAAGILGGP